MKARRRLLVAVVISLGAVTTACSPPTIQPCQRYDALTLTRENDFEARLDWNSSATVNLNTERVEVAITAIHPIKGPIEIVHLVGDTEADRWRLTLPDGTNMPTSLCAIAPAGGLSNCGVALQDMPFSPGGYYFLRAGDNTVLEAGLSFWLCE